MKQKSADQQYLQSKFDELPVQGDSTTDWRNLQKALDVALPIAASSFLLYGKTWLTKKLWWLLLVSLGAGSAAVILVDQSRTAKQHARQVTGKRDTTRSKHKTLVPIAPKNFVIVKHKKSPMAAGKDTTSRKPKMSPPLSPKDTIISKHKTLPPVAPTDTVFRKHKTSPPVAPKDSVIRKHKT
ncbi:MAG TPA: hypothetical protein VHE59_03905 [Mucilaginibacter sp.]|nr:hypothetical protein [Mucilaginibacter sp.]